MGTVNTETVMLNMTPREADSVAFVLMSALKRITMLDRERRDTTDAANVLFSGLGYDVRTTDHGDRIEGR
jgi:hypothetical protein